MLLRFLGILLTLIVTLIEPAFAQAQSPFMGRVTSDRVYVRSGQNVNFETVATLNKNDTLVVLGKSYGWLKVKFPAQAKGFIKAEYVELLTPEVGAIKVDRVNVRCAPNTTATIIGKLERGNRFYISAPDKDWVSIKPLDQFIGWVKAELVEPQRGAKVPAVLYPEPPPAVEKVSPAAVVTPAAVVAAPRPVLFKKLTNGQVDAMGILKKENNVYRIYKDTAVVCVVDGPDAVLAGFVGRPVKVRGTVKEGSAQPDADPVVSLAKINFLL